MIQEKKDMLRVWNMVLVLLPFSLTIFGTFLTRSGVISSVHSFTQSGLGPFFIGFLLFVLVVAGGLLAYRLPELRTQATVESFLSRESAFLFNNLVLVGIAFAVFWGTVFPVVSEWVRGVKITVGPPAGGWERPAGATADTSSTSAWSRCSSALPRRASSASRCSRRSRPARKRRRESSRSATSGSPSRTTRTSRGSPPSSRCGATARR